MAQVPLPQPIKLQPEATSWELTRVVMHVPTLIVTMTVAYFDADGALVGNRTFSESFAEMAGSAEFGALQQWLVGKLIERGAMSDGGPRKTPLREVVPGGR